MNHKDLEAWKGAMKLVELVYAFVRKLTKSEDFVLSAQLRKTAISIPSNLAEGAARKCNVEFTQFCYISLAFLSDLETQLMIAEIIFQAPVASELNQDTQVRKLILGLINYLKKNKSHPTKKAQLF